MTLLFTTTLLRQHYDALAAEAQSKGQDRGSIGKAVRIATLLDLGQGCINPDSISVLLDTLFSSKMASLPSRLLVTTMSALPSPVSRLDRTMADDDEARRPRRKA